MAAKALIDTGAIVAILNPQDRWHGSCVEAFGRLRLPLATSGAVCAEVFHLLSRYPTALELVWQFLRSGAVTVLPVTDVDMPDLARLMIKYRDRPMNFADATLVRLAKRESLSTILTVDHEDFETFRIGARSRFRIVPSRGERP
jgi:predicted nucleic acid-binding protein